MGVTSDWLRKNYSGLDVNKIPHILGELGEFRGRGGEEGGGMGRRVRHDG